MTTRDPQLTALSDFELRSRVTAMTKDLAYIDRNPMYRGSMAGAGQAAYLNRLKKEAQLRGRPHLAEPRPTPQVGDTVMLVHPTTKEAEAAEVTKVGRQYFYIGRDKFRIIDRAEVIKPGSGRPQRIAYDETEWPDTGPN